VPIDEDELKAVEIESNHTVDITGFVPKADIDRRYLDKPYYITPQGKMGADAFAVIRDAMKDKDRVALARSSLPIANTSSPSSRSAGAYSARRSVMI
jgi:DNA end-binding protein Ku